MSDNAPRGKLTAVGRKQVLLAATLLAAACASTPDAVSTTEPATVTTPPVSTTQSDFSSTAPATSISATAEEPGAEPPQSTSLTVNVESAASTSTSSLPTTTTLSSPPEPEPISEATEEPPPASLRFAKVAEGARSPIFLTAPAGAEYSYLAEQSGRIMYMTSDQLATEPVLDITEKVRFRGEQGLLGIAIHPSAPTRLFVHYTDRGGNTVVSEFAISENGNTADPGSERTLFTADQPASNHNGGMIQFGPDGYLYLGLGDGGRAGDYFGHGQRADTVLAALVRINPDTGSAEVWWYGLRNPWRFWIDEPTGLTYIADVGQDGYEEINVATLSDHGLNFGWPITEGLHCYEPRQGCEAEGLTLPVLEIVHDHGGTCSVTGGVVYRGPRMPGLWGHYFYSDYCGGYLRSFHWNGALAEDLTEWTPDLGSVVSFGTDGAGEMYVLTTDAVYRIAPGT